MVARSQSGYWSSKLASCLEEKKEMERKKVNARFTYRSLPPSRKKVLRKKIRSLSPKRKKKEVQTEAGTESTLSESTYDWEQNLLTARTRAKIPISAAKRRAFIQDLLKTQQNHDSHHDRLSAMKRSILQPQGSAIPSQPENYDRIMELYKSPSPGAARESTRNQMLNAMKRIEIDRRRKAALKVKNLIKASHSDNLLGAVQRADSAVTKLSDDLKNEESSVKSKALANDKDLQMKKTDTCRKEDSRSDQCFQLQMEYSSEKRSPAPHESNQNGLTYERSNVFQSEQATSDKQDERSEKAPSTCSVYNHHAVSLTNELKQDKTSQFSSGKLRLEKYNDFLTKASFKEETTVLDEGNNDDDRHTRESNQEYNVERSKVDKIQGNENSEIKKKERIEGRTISTKKSRGVATHEGGSCHECISIHSNNSFSSHSSETVDRAKRIIRKKSMERRVTHKTSESQQKLDDIHYFSRKYPTFRQLYKTPSHIPATEIVKRQSLPFAEKYAVYPPFQSRTMQIRDCNSDCEILSLNSSRRDRNQLQPFLAKKDGTSFLSEAQAQNRSSKSKFSQEASRPEGNWLPDPIAAASDDELLKNSSKNIINLEHYTKTKMNTHNCEIDQLFGIVTEHNEETKKLFCNGIHNDEFVQFNRIIHTSQSGISNGIDEIEVVSTASSSIMEQVLQDLHPSTSSGGTGFETNSSLSNPAHTISFIDAEDKNVVTINHDDDTNNNDTNPRNFVLHGLEREKPSISDSEAILEDIKNAALDIDKVTEEAIEDTKKQESEKSARYTHTQLNDSFIMASMDPIVVSKVKEELNRIGMPPAIVNILDAGNGIETEYCPSFDYDTSSRVKSQSKSISRSYSGSYSRSYSGDSTGRSGTYSQSQSYDEPGDSHDKYQTSKSRSSKISKSIQNPSYSYESGSGSYD